MLHGGLDTTAAGGRDSLQEQTESLRKPLFGFSGFFGIDIAINGVRRVNRTLLSSPPILFSRALLANPGAVGAVCPSSLRLARALAGQVAMPNDNELVLELGAGTGMVTEALLARGIDRNRLVVVERDRFLARHLKERFPDVAVIHGNAVKLCQLCNRYGRRVGSVVSSLPLLSLPPATVDDLGKALQQLLGSHGSLVQYTYRFGKGPGPLTAYMERTSTQTIWANIPPARVEVFRARY